MSDSWAVQSALDRANAASQAKSEFLSVISHELRTPLNPIIGLTELVMGQVDDPEILESLSLIDSSAKSLLKIIEDLIQVSQIGAGPVTVNLEPAKLSAIFEETERLYCERYDRHGVVLHIDRSELPENWDDAWILTDQKRIKQVLTHLLDNCAKIKHKGVSGEVELSYGVKVRDEQARLEVAVRDNGIGIDQDHLGRIFEPFHQADHGDRRKYGGMGKAIQPGSAHGNHPQVEQDSVRRSGAESMTLQSG